MSDARRNPIGLPAPKGAVLVRAGDGEHTHALDPQTGVHLCRSGIKHGKVPTLHKTNARFVTCYRCIKRLSENTVQRTFSPSYNASSQAQYDEEVRTGKKPLYHTQVRGGRQAARGELGPFKMSRSSAQRLVDRSPPWDARTQSPSVWAKTLKRMGYSVDALANPRGKPQYGKRGIPQRRQALIAQIQTALDAYRAQQPSGTVGLYVPPFPGPLIEAGLPKAIAYMLVRRAGNTFIAEATSIAPAPEKMTLGSALLQRFGRLPALVTAGGSHFLQVKGLGLLEQVQVQLDTGRWASVATAEQIDARFDKWVQEQKRQEGGISSSDVESSVPQVLLPWLQERIDQRLRSSSLAHRKEGARVRLTFSVMKEPVELHLSTLQHFDVGGRSAPGLEVRYSTLENVPLSLLPSVLAGIHLRTRKKGRSLPPYYASAASLENPMSYWEDQYSNDPFGPSASIPTARRNRGRPRTSKKLKHVPLPPAPNNDYVRMTNKALESLARKGDSGAKRELARRGREDKAVAKFRGRPARSAKKGSSKSRGRKKSTSKAKTGGGLSEWNSLVKAAAKLGVYKIGMNRIQVEHAIAKAKGKGTSSRKKSSASSSSSSAGRKAGTTWPKFRSHAAKRGYSLKQAQAAWKKYKAGGTIASCLPPKKTKAKAAPKKKGSTGRRRAAANPRDTFELDTPGSYLAADPWHPVYEQVIGQFGVSEGLTHGLQPANRRNPSRKRKAKRNGRKLSAYNLFCQEKMREGYSLAECARMWRRM